MDRKLADRVSSKWSQGVVQTNHWLIQLAQDKFDNFTKHHGMCVLMKNSGKIV